MRKVFIAMSLLAAVTLAAAPALAQGGKKPAQTENSASPVPGKPGDKNIVEIAVGVNELLGEFDYLLGAIGCLTDDEGNNPVVDLLSGSHFGSGIYYQDPTRRCCHGPLQSNRCGRGNEGWIYFKKFCGNGRTSG